MIIGRGRSFHDAAGSQRLRVIATSFLPEYTKATTKQDKTVIVSRIVDMVRVACPKNAAFIKLINGRWWSLNEFRAREKVGYVLRDLLHDKYRSSSKAKVAKRRVQRQEKKQASAAAIAAAATANNQASNQVLHHQHHLIQPQMCSSGNTHPAGATNDQWIQPPMEVVSSSNATSPAAFMGMMGSNVARRPSLSNFQPQGAAAYPLQNQRALPPLCGLDYNYLTRCENITNESIAGLTSGNSSLSLPLPDLMVNSSPRLATGPIVGTNNMDFLTSTTTGDNKALDQYMMSLMMNNSQATRPSSSALAMMESGNKVQPTAFPSRDVDAFLLQQQQQQLDDLKNMNKKNAPANLGMKNVGNPALNCNSNNSFQMQKLQQLQQQQQLQQLQLQQQQEQLQQQQSGDLTDDMRALFES